MNTVIRPIVSLSLAGSLMGVFALQADEVGPLSAGFNGRNADAISACSTGLTPWDHCQQIWQSGATTYCWLKQKGVWVRSSNDVGEGAMIACTASTTKVSSYYGKYCRFHITSCASGYGDWDYMELWEY